MTFFLRPRLLGLILMMICFNAWAQLALEEETAKKHGLDLYGMLRNDEAIPYLEIPAKAGDIEAQYALGDIGRRKHHGVVSDESRDWFERAARQGHMYSMLSLTARDIALCVLSDSCDSSKKSPEEWKTLALSINLPKATGGDGEAMLFMYYLTDERAWLTQSAESGFGEAQYYLGREYRQGSGWFLTPARRQQAAESWFLKAAEAGHLFAIRELINVRHAQNDLKAVRFWTERALEAGDFGATARYAKWLSDESTDLYDLVKAYGLTLLLDQAEFPHMRGDGYRPLQQIAERMTPQQIEAGELFAKEWKNTHPSLRRAPFGR